MKGMLLSLAALAIVLPISPAPAAGSYDGSWAVEAPGAGPPDQTGQPRCPPVRFSFDVKDNQVKGSLRRVTNVGGQSGTTVQQGAGRGSSPISGKVAADGSFTANWERFHAFGKLSGDTAELKWQGQCGPRVAKGSRTG